MDLSAPGPGGGWRCGAGRRRGDRARRPRCWVRNARGAGCPPALLWQACRPVARGDGCVARLTVAPDARLGGRSRQPAVCPEPAAPACCRCWPRAEAQAGRFPPADDGPGLPPARQLGRPGPTGGRRGAAVRGARSGPAGAWRPGARWSGAWTSSCGAVCWAGAPLAAAGGRSTAHQRRAGLTLSAELRLLGEAAGRHRLRFGAGIRG